jgi:uncharacterized SAM-binding protein YcdF (DUF218 family)
MMTLFIFFLIIITISSLLCRYIKTSIIFSLAALIVFLAVGSGLIASLLLKPLEYPYLTSSPPRWAKRNAIILLGAGAIRVPAINEIKPTMMAYSRINEAVLLYLACKKSGNQCTVIISGGDALSSGKSEAQVYQGELLGLGVNNADIILESHSMNTYKNAELTSTILKSGQFDRIFLVTSGLHMKRSLLYFSRFGVRPIPVMADYISPFFSIVPLGYNFAITDFAVHEYMGIIRLHVYNYFGWNVKSSLPGAV